MCKKKKHVLAKFTLQLVMSPMYRYTKIFRYSKVNPVVVRSLL